jgi:hypothetical protein
MSRLEVAKRAVAPVENRGAIILAVVLALLGASVLGSCGGGSGSSPVALETSVEHTQAKEPPEPKAPSIDAPAPPPGTELTTVKDPGRVNVISNGNGFAIVDSVTSLSPDRDESTLTTYNALGEELTEIPSGELAGECGAADVVVPGLGRTIVTELESHTRTEGINQVEYPSVLKAWSAETGEPIWSTPIRYDQGEEWEEPGCGAYDGYLDGFSATADGRWGLFGETDAAFGGARVIDLKTGQVQPGLHAEGVLGGYPIITPEDEYGPQRYKALDPSDGRVLGTLTTDADFYQQQEQLSMAARGALEWDGSGASPAAMSSDAGRLIVVEEPEDGAPYAVAYSLPDFHVAWQRPRGQSVSLVAEGGGIVLEQRENPSGETTFWAGVNDQTGEQEWTLPAGEVCGTTESQMLMAVNGQLATIDLKTSEQISYEEEGESCPAIMPGGITTYAEGGEIGEMTGLTVSQALEP